MVRFNGLRAYSKTLGVYMLTLGMSFLGGSAAFAGDCTTGCTTSGGPNCCECEQVFKNAGCKLTDDLARLTAECCNSAPSCIDESCVEDPCVGDGCTDSCPTCMWNTGDPWKLVNHDTLNIGGFTSFGYVSKPDFTFNQPGDQSKLNLNQFYLYAEKVADGSKGLDWGFRFDAVYGTDGSATQSYGNRPGTWDYQNGYDHGIYAFALPQAYAEIASGDLSVKVGHFYTLLGYEVVPATGNFFMTHAFTMYNSEAFTHTGALATYAVNDNLTVYGGWTAGWDTGFDRYLGGSSFLGGFTYGVTDSLSLTYITTFGDLGWFDQGYTHSIVATYDATDKLQFVGQSDLVTRADGVQNYGTNGYAFYTINDCVKLGSNFEWWQNGNDDDVYMTRLGVNIKPHANVTIRPEWRYQWNYGAPNGVVAVDDDEASIFGIDTVITF
ncbi:porin family protein [Lacunimicrobium album]